MRRPLSRVNRRRFLQRSAVALTACSILPGRSRAQERKARLKFGVLGINHEHIFRMVEAVREGGGELAMIFADKPDPNHGAKFLRENPDVRRAREERELLEATDIALVISAARPGASANRDPRDARRKGFSG